MEANHAEQLEYATAHRSPPPRWIPPVLAGVALGVPFVGAAAFAGVMNLAESYSWRTRTVVPLAFGTLITASVGGVLLAWAARRAAIRANVGYARVLASAVIAIDTVLGLTYLVSIIGSFFG